MKQNILIAYLSCSVLLIGCTVEPDLSKYTTFVTNQTSEIVNISGYDANRTKVFENILDPEDESERCEVFVEAFYGLASCGIDSLVVKFNNDKGYICAFTTDGAEFCFNDKFPLGNDTSFIDLGNNIYEFIITQQDFEDAYNLPE